MKMIPLSQRGKHSGKYFAIVDDRDYNKIMALGKWKVNIKHRGAQYATQNAWDKKEKRCFTRHMHHEIIGKPQKGMRVDHKDGDGLNNRRRNLRICTAQQNQRNRRIGKRGYKGVSRFVNKRQGTCEKPYKLWRARLYINQKEISLGYFKTRKMAIIAYNNGAKKYFGKFARLNKVA